MSYEYITQYNAVSYTPGRQGYSPNKIIIHHWGEDGQTFEGTISWFENPACTTSAHDVLEAGRVACMVNYYDTAYHADDWNANLTSIGIECRPEMSDGDLETLCEHIAYLWGIYGVLPIYGHKDFSSTACPGRYYAKLDWIYNHALEIYNGNTDNNEGDDEDMKWAEFEASEEYALLKQLVANKKATEPNSWFKEDLQKAVDAGITTGERPRDIATREEVAVMILRGKE